MWCCMQGDYVSNRARDGNSGSAESSASLLAPTFSCKAYATLVVRSSMVFQREILLVAYNACPFPPYWHLQRNELFCEEHSN